MEAEEQDLIQPSHPLETGRERDRRGRETEQETERERVQMCRWRGERSWTGQVWSRWRDEGGVKGEGKGHHGREEEQAYRMGSACWCRRW